jgi:3-oxoacyl-(acyl-carrier-protein) synthase
MKIYLTNHRTICTTKTEFIDDVPYPQKIHWFPDTYKNIHTGLVYAPHKLAEKILDKELLDSLKQTKKGKTAFILAGGNSNFAGVNHSKSKPTRLTYDYKILALSLTQVYAGRVAAACDANDLVITDASACASSLKVMMDVQTLIKVYGFSRVVVLSVEDSVSNSTLQFFGESGASLVQKMEDEKNIKPSAFDSINQGFYVGQGSVFAVFEAENSLSYDPKIELVGAWSASELSTNAIGQRDDGQGFKNAFDGAMHYTGVKPNEITIIKTHGTGTKSNNQAEKAAILSTFNDFVATSYKQKIGHTMGASGLLETILLSQDIKSGQVPAIENRTEKDKVFLSEPADVPDGFCLSLAAGMGNVYSAAIFNMRV